MKYGNIKDVTKGQKIYIYNTFVMLKGLSTEKSNLDFETLTWIYCSLFNFRHILFLKHCNQSPLKILTSNNQILPPTFYAPLVVACWFFALYWPLPPMYSNELRYTPLNNNCSPFPCSERVREAKCIVLAALSGVYRSSAEYIGESGEGGERNMERARREKIYEKSMLIV